MPSSSGHRCACSGCRCRATEHCRQRRPRLRSKPGRNKTTAPQITGELRQMLCHQAGETPTRQDSGSQTQSAPSKSTQDAMHTNRLPQAHAEPHCEKPSQRGANTADWDRARRRWEQGGSAGAARNVHGSECNRRQQCTGGHTQYNGSNREDCQVMDAREQLDESTVLQ